MTNNIDWFLDLLNKELDSAETKLRLQIKPHDINSILNLLAVYLLKHDYNGILITTEEILRQSARIPTESLIKIIEYRVIADLALGNYDRIVGALDLVRRQILTFFIDFKQLLHNPSIRDLLDEQVILYLKRRYTVAPLYHEIYEFSKTFQLALYDAYKQDCFIDLQSSEKLRMYSYLSIFLAKLSLKEAAKKCINIAKEIKDSYISRVAAGTVWFLLNNFDHAFDELNYALANYTDVKNRGIEAKINIAQLYALEGEYKIALNYITEALRVYPDPLARLVRGKILLELQRFNEAVLAFRALLNTTNKNIRTVALLNLAVCYILKKKYKKAFDCLWSAYMLNPTNEYISMLTKTLKILSDR